MTKTLITGGTGKIGRRVAEFLTNLHHPITIGSRSFTEVLDGHNAHLHDGVREVLGRDPRDFGDYVRRTAQTGVWNG